MRLRIFAGLLCLLLAISFAACTGNKGESEYNTEENGESITDTVGTEDTSDDSASDTSESVGDTVFGDDTVKEDIIVDGFN